MTNSTKTNKGLKGAPGGEALLATIVALTVLLL